MADNGEIFTEGVCDVEESIYVAVGKNLKDGKSLISWALSSFQGKGKGKNICLLHVHQPSQSVSLSKFLDSSVFFFCEFSIANFVKLHFVSK